MFEKGLFNSFNRPTKEQYEKIMTAETQRVLHFIENLRNPNEKGVHSFQETFVAAMIAELQAHIGAPVFNTTMRVFEGIYPLNAEDKDNPRTWDGKPQE